MGSPSISVDATAGSSGQRRETPLASLLQLLGLPGVEICTPRGMFSDEFERARCNSAARTRPPQQASPASSLKKVNHPALPHSQPTIHPPLHSWGALLFSAQSSIQIIHTAGNLHMLGQHPLPLARRVRPPCADLPPLIATAGPHRRQDLVIFASSISRHT